MGKQSVQAPARSAGVVGAARWKGVRGYRGRPAEGDGSGLNGALGAGHGGESDRVVRAMKPGNAGGAKDPDFWRAFDEGRGEGRLAMSLETPDKIRNLQRKLYCKAKAEPAFRFYVLYDKICRDDILLHAYRLARANAGAPGVDEVTFVQIEEEGLEAWLAGLREELVSKTYRLSSGAAGDDPKAEWG